MRLSTGIANSVYDAVLALVYPQACKVCGASAESRHDGVVCKSCWEAAPLFGAGDARCWKCGAPGSANVNADNANKIRCGRCDDEAFTVARACGAYEGALRASVLELKRVPHVSGRLADLMLQVQQREPLQGADLILPVPLHPAREAQRGFNQAAVLAKAVARCSGIPLEEHGLVRIAQTQMHRAGMDAKARRQSVTNAFAVRHTDLIKARSVLLVDDVFTTGATVSACAAVLQEAGVGEVFVLTVARA